MNVTKTQNGTELIAAVEGRLDTLTSPEFEQKMKAGLSGVTSLVLDFAKLEYISSAGLRALLNIKAELNGVAKMKVINANELVKEVFEVTGFNSIMSIE